MKKINILFLLFLGVAFQIFAQEFDGYALYNPQNNGTAYLIDGDGEIAHTWSSNRSCNYTVQIKDNGNIVRGTVYSNNTLTGAAIGGLIEELDADGNVVWEYIHSTADYCQHHDITLIGDNVLITAWNVKSTSELQQAGASSYSSEKWPTSLVEIAQDGTGGEIVWEWHIWDHMIQDYDSGKDNYGVISDHPELIDVNMITPQGPPKESSGEKPPGGGGDWFHVNGVDYNATLDQIAFSSRFASEIYIIDHSTTTAEAASHSGGNSGMGGDILYRWGNPANYGMSGTQMIPAAVHDVRWIKEGRPNAGFLQVFNNEGSNGNSTVDAIETPLNGYNYDITSGQAFTPSSYSWRHDCLDNADGQSASDRMSNGNTFVNLSQDYMYEVDSEGNVVWMYNAGGPPKAFRYECDHPGIITLLDDPCDVTTSISSNDLMNEWTVYPNPSNGVFNISGIAGSNYTVDIVDLSGRTLKTQKLTTQVDLSDLQSGMYIMRIIDQNGTISTKSISLIK